METLNGERFIVADHLVQDPQGSSWLEDFSLESCVIVGPVVLIPTRDVEFRANKLDPKQFWTLELNRGYQGGVGLRRCRFIQCTFEDVGIAGPLEFLQGFFEG